MPWWNIRKQNRKDQDQDQERQQQVPKQEAATAAPAPVPPRAAPQARMPGAQPGTQPGARPAGQPIIGGRPLNPDDPEQRARRRQRLERRVQDITFDIAQAEQALGESNRWSERVAALDAAILQTRSDREATLAAPSAQPAITLPSLPVVVELVQPDEPAEVRFRVGEMVFRYSEEVDWAERGFQKAAAVLQRVDGQPESLMPGSIPAERHAELHAHLAHGLSMLADTLRDEALDGVPHPARTLADLASPCPVCGGWRDLKGRCPACQERQWRAEALRADGERLLKERNEQLEELNRMRDRLPILHRQLADARAELARG